MKLSLSALTAAAFFSAGISFSAPAMATNGLIAIGTCYNHPGCIVAMNDGVDIDIVTEDGTLIHCEDLESECEAPPPPPPPHPPSRTLGGKHLPSGVISNMFEPL